VRVFRPTRKDKAGKGVAYRVWYVEFRDHLETIRRLPAFTDRKQSESFGRNLETLVAARVNREAPSVELGRWLESLPSVRVARNGAVWGNSVQSGAVKGEADGAAGEVEKTPENMHFSRDLEADGEGFEPPLDFRPKQFSRLPPSTTRPPIQNSNSSRPPQAMSIFDPAR
jgi:hypothetical protein